MRKDREQRIDRAILSIRRLDDAWPVRSPEMVLEWESSLKDAGIDLVYAAEERKLLIKEVEVLRRHISNEGEMKADEELGRLCFPKTHYISTHTDNFTAIASGRKAFEVVNSIRNVRLGDAIIFEDLGGMDHSSCTGLTITRYVSHIQHDLSLDAVIAGLSNERKTVHADSEGLRP